MNELALLTSATGTPSESTYVDDVFSTYLYTGNGSTQTINNGIDLAGKGGMVWCKQRSDIQNHVLFDSARGSANILSTDATGANGTGYPFSLTSSGFSLGTYSGMPNTSGQTYVSWTFRRAPKFFDAVTYTGNGATSNRFVNHSLGVVPGMIIIKRTDSTSDWAVWSQRGGGNHSSGLSLNTTDPAGISGNLNQYSTFFDVTAVRSYAGRASGADMNASGASYVAYLFAHDTSTDGIIQCGSFTTDGSGNATVNLGWEPQYLTFKNSTGSADNWKIYDSMRGWDMGTDDRALNPNLSSAETSNSNGNPTSTGFLAANLASSTTYIYLAIRRPNKPPTTGTQVYNAIARVGTNTTIATASVGFAPDLLLIKSRSLGYGAPVFHDRLRGAPAKIDSSSSNAEVATSPVVSIDQSGYTTSGDAQGSWNQASAAYADWNFRRAPGFFDVVCYTYMSFLISNHSLGVAPELMIFKARGATQDWFVWHKDLPPNTYLSLNTTAGAASSNWIDSVTSTTFRAALSGGVSYVAYLFATKAGISKVGSYTGNGGSQTINCGFTTGARFFLVKATSTTGSWWIYDSARGIVAATDPALQLNSTAAEATSADAVDPTSVGIIVNQEATCSINANGESYIYLAIA